MSRTSQPAEAVPTLTTLAERYRVLLDIGHTLSGTLGYDELFGTLYQETTKVLETAGFYVAIYEKERDLATVVFYADRGEQRAVSVTYRGSESEVIRTGKGSLVKDRRGIPSLLVLGDEGGAPVTRSAISAPIMAKGQVVGAISAQSYEPAAYSDADLELLQGIADIAGVALENARYVKELERRRHEAEQIEEIGRALAGSLDTQEVLGKVVDAVVSVMEVDGSAVWSLRGSVARVTASGGEVRLPVDLTWDLTGPVHDQLVEGLASVKVEDFERSPVLSEAMREHLKEGSGLAVPLVVGKKVVGVLTAGSREARAFTAEDERVLGRIASQASVALENARLHASLHALSLTDPLTGLPNRRHFQMHLQREVAAAGRGRELVVVMFDLDNFKGFNDSQGHLAGDTALRAFSQILSDEIRAMNLAARYGGDEFVSVLSETQVDGALGFVERVRKRVAGDPILAPNEISVSHGLAWFDGTQIRTMDDLISAADADLYRRKATKRP